MKKLPMIFLCVACALCSVAKAETNKEAAKASYQKGRDLFKSGNYTKAARELQKAYSLKPHPALLKYIGDCYFKMNKGKKAIKYYKLYLKEAPQAADKDKVERKVRQLELVIGTSDDESKQEVAAPSEPNALSPAPQPESTKGNQIESDLMPTGEDKEVPLALTQASMKKGSGRREQTDTSGTSGLKIMKWVSVGLAATGLAMGITFNRLAASKASELEDEVVKTNPTRDKPTVAFSREHFDLEQAYKRNNTISIISFITFGVGTASSVVLFLLDRPKRNRRTAAIAPIVSENTFGFAGSWNF